MDYIKNFVINGFTFSKNFIESLITHIFNYILCLFKDVFTYILTSILEEIGFKKRYDNNLR